MSQIVILCFIFSRLYTYYFWDSPVWMNQYKLRVLSLNAWLQYMPPMLQHFLYKCLYWSTSVTPPGCITSGKLSRFNTYFELNSPTRSQMHTVRTGWIVPKVRVKLRSDHMLYLGTERWIENHATLDVHINWGDVCSR